MNVFKMEIRRSLARRAIRVLIALGLLGCVIAGVISFIGSSGQTTAELQFNPDGHPAVMTEWWDPDVNDGFLAIAMFFLILGGLFGGATVAGGEWRAGTVTTLLTWEPRRLRLLVAQGASCAILAFLISVVLQILFLASFLPSVVAHGTTDGVDASFWTGLVAAISRTSLLTAMAAVLAVALATIARNTAFAVIAVFAWLVVGENLIRGLRPSLAPWLWAENVGTVMVWGQLSDVDVVRGPLAALATLIAYCVIAAAVAAVTFDRRDIAAAT